MNVIPVGERSAQRLEYDRSDRFSRNESVGTIIECIATAGGRQHRRATSEYEERRRTLNVYTTRERHFALGIPQTLASKMDGHQGARACGVDGYGRPLQIQVI